MLAGLREQLDQRRSGLRLPRHSVRLRLTLLYGALFLASGAALLTITYFLVARQYSGNFFVSQQGPPVGAPPGVAGLTVVTTQAHRQSSAALNQLLLQSGIALGIMSIVSIWLGWLVAGRVLRPLRTITIAARTISASSLHERLALHGPDDELKQLGDTFDGLLARLESAFDAQRQFVANASHELRTPLTLERALVEVALADPKADVETLRETCRQVLEAGQQQERLIEALLTLSRSQRGLDHRAPVDLAAIAADAVQSIDMDGLAVDSLLRPAATRGDPRLVERLVTNLLDNAVRHNLPRGHITVATETRNGHAVLRVTNSGPIVPAEELDRLLEPFQRLDGARARSNGLGLGLSIVQAIATAHDATLSTRAQRDGGLRVEVGFPAPDAA